MSLQTEQVK
jgi:hypothetical protein